MRKTIIFTLSLFLLLFFLRIISMIFIGDDADDWFSKLDNSFFIFVFLSFIPFLILLMHDFVIHLANAKQYSTKYYLIQGVFCSLAIVFFFTMLNPDSYSASPFTRVLLLLFIFIPIYVIFQVEIRHLKEWAKNKRIEEGYKFLLLFSGGIIVIYLANNLCIFIDEFIFNSDGNTSLATYDRVPLEIGFVASFALGNWLNNLRRYFFELRRQSKRLIISEGKTLASEAELNAIQASVNPHFLYNSLNSIASLAKIDPDKTEAMALALSKFYKYNTNRTGEHLSSVRDEIDMIQNYLNIEKIRFGDQLQYNIQIDPKVMSCKIPHFILQPLVENAIKHGYNDATETTDIQLNIQAQNNQLSVQLFDTGKSFHEGLNSGYGLKSVMKKLELLFPNRHTIDFINAPLKHVSITIEIDQNEY